MLSDIKNSYGILNYEHDKSNRSSLFFEGSSLLGVDMELNYVVNKKYDIVKLKKFHIIESTGPTLVSYQLRKIIERTAVGEAEFFDVSIMFKDQKIDGFCAINLKSRVNCVDLAKSEYEPTNFDPNDPKYCFDYMVLLEEFPCELNISICNEQHVNIVVNEKIKNACVDEKIKGLIFCSAMDMTHKDRSVSEKI